MTNRRPTKCSTCKQTVTWYVSKRTGQPITIGGKSYGDCGCDLTSWVNNGGAVKQIQHAAVA